MDREKFMELMKTTRAGKAIMRALEEIGPVVKIDDLIIENLDEDVNIIILPNRLPFILYGEPLETFLIQWYKRYHWGRCLVTSGIKDEEEMKKILVWIRDKIEDYMR